MKTIKYDGAPDGVEKYHPLTGELIKIQRFVRTPANFRLGQSYGDLEYNTGISQTVPDQSLSLTELLSRYQRGLPLPTREPKYSEHEDLPDFDKMDFFERAAFMEENAAHIKQTQEKLQKAEFTKRQKAERAKKDAAAASTLTKPSEEDPIL